MEGLNYVSVISCTMYVFLRVVNVRLLRVRGRNSGAVLLVWMWERERVIYLGILEGSLFVVRMLRGCWLKPFE